MRPNGDAIIVGPDHPVKELETFTCGHCNTLVICRSSDGREVDIGGGCHLCDKMICGPCVDRGSRAGKSSCDPFEKKLERMEAADRLRRQILGVG